MIKNHSVSGRNRHFCIKMEWLREQVANGVVEFKFVPSKFNVTDIFTKILPALPYQAVRDLLLASRAHHQYDLTLGAPKNAPPRGGC